MNGGLKLGVGAAAVALLVALGVYLAGSEERTIRKGQQAYVAKNCPTLLTYEACVVDVTRREDAERDARIAAAQAAKPSPLASPPPTATAPPAASVEPPKKRSIAERLAGITQLQGIVQRRVARGQETDEACDARRKSEEARYDAAALAIGKDALATKTRYSDRAPNLGADVESFVDLCLSCVEVGGPERVPHECTQSVTVLNDLAADIRTGTR